jgi:hypothetical protein
MARGMPAAAVLSPEEGAAAFRLVFAAAILCIGVAIAAILTLREQPLRGAAASSS